MYIRAHDLVMYMKIGYGIVGVFYKLNQYQISHIENSQHNLPNTKQGGWLIYAAKVFCSSLHNCSNLVGVMANYSPQISSTYEVQWGLDLATGNEH